MRRIALWAIILAVVGTASAAVADLAVETDEERIDSMLREVASARGKAEAILRHVDLESVPLEVSAGRDVERFDESDYDDLSARAADLDLDLGDRRVEVRQSQITVSGAEARVIANFVLDGDEVTPCDVTLRRVRDRWLVSRIRVMR
ncbi:MAG: hypothetical protein HYY06_06125 [Deltaproteobacteria bacterium]|nr:hypothetical protein [Deltaproteobacteria bacterium]